MDTAKAAVEAYIAAVTDPSPGNLAALEPKLDEDLVVLGLVGAGAGRANVLQALAAPNATRLVAAAQWSDPGDEDGELIREARLPGGVPFAGLRFAFRIHNGERIARIGQQLMPAAPPEAQPVSITADLKALIDGALANGTPVIVGYVDANGVPHLSPRGSAQVLNETQVALWSRDPNGGILKGIAVNPNVALYYRDPKSRASVTITGRAHVPQDSRIRDTIYDNQPEIERNLDGRKKGVGIVVDVDLLEAAGPAGRTRMVRE
jgi:hypothetical protein